MNRKSERIIVIEMAAFLVGVFIYQVAYGMTENVTNGNITVICHYLKGIQFLAISSPQYASLNTKGAGRGLSW
jgi:hypothetical protein